MNDDALRLRRAIEQLHRETGLSVGSLHEMMEAVAALLLDRAGDRAFSDEANITVTSEGLCEDLLALGLPASEVTTDNVERILESLLSLAR